MLMNVIILVHNVMDQLKISVLLVLLIQFNQDLHVSVIQDLPHMITSVYQLVQVYFENLIITFKKLILQYFFQNIFIDGYTFDTTLLRCVLDC